jgi:hypothetical protein
MQERLDASNHARDDAMDAATELRKEVATLKAGVEDGGYGNSSQRRATALVDEMTSQLESERADRARERRALEQERDDALRELQGLRRRVEVLEQTAGAREERLQNLLEETETMREYVSGAEEREAKLKSDRQQLSDVLRVVREQLRKQQDTINTLEENLATLSSRTAAALAESESSHNDLVAVRQENVRLFDRVVALEREYEEFIDAIVPGGSAGVAAGGGNLSIVVTSTVPPPTSAASGSGSGNASAAISSRDAASAAPAGGGGGAGSVSAYQPGGGAESDSRTTDIRGGRFSRVSRAIGPSAEGPQTAAGRVSSLVRKQTGTAAVLGQHVTRVSSRQHMVIAHTSTAATTASTATSSAKAHRHSVTVAPGGSGGSKSLLPAPARNEDADDNYSEDWRDDDDRNGGRSRDGRGPSAAAKERSPKGVARRPSPGDDASSAHSSVADAAARRLHDMGGSDRALFQRRSGAGAPAGTDSSPTHAGGALEMDDEYH